MNHILSFVYAGSLVIETDTPSAKKRKRWRATAPSLVTSLSNSQSRDECGVGFGRDFTDVNTRGQDVRSDQLAGSFGLDMRPSRA